jgi:hypothetical protein
MIGIQSRNLFLCRIGLFFTDHEIIKGNIEKAKQMLEEGGDWDRRNRLKVGTPAPSCPNL